MTEYYTAIKRMRAWHLQQTDATRDHYANNTNPYIKSHFLLFVVVNIERGFLKSMDVVYIF